MLGNAYGGELPLSGLLKISQSRSCPRPPRLMLPAATPPSGNAIIFNRRPVKTRGNGISLACAWDDGVSGVRSSSRRVLVPGCWAAAPAPSATCCRKDLRAVFLPGMALSSIHTIHGLHACAERLKLLCARVPRESPGGNCIEFGALSAHEWSRQKSTLLGGC